MKAVIFSGSHSRHLFIHEEVIKHFDDLLVIFMKREEIMPSPKKEWSNHDKKNFNLHFSNRKKIEDKIYGNLNEDKIFNQQEIIKITSRELNSQKIALKIKKFNADFCFIFGTDLILEPVINVLPENKINLHLGLSPFYKGSATLFWPFYFLQPQFAGVTFHQITKDIDAGDIIHQSVPDLEYGDTIHEVAAKCVIKAKKDIPTIIDYFKKNNSFLSIKQKKSGKIWFMSDFHVSHLRTIYDLYNDKIVDEYLKGNLCKKRPDIYSIYNNQNK